MGKFRRLDKEKFKDSKNTDRWRYWPKNSSQAQKKSSPDFHFHLVLAIVLFVYLWILLITYYADKGASSRERLSSQSSSNHKGIIVSLKNQPQDFEAKGFECFSKYPLLRYPKLQGSPIRLLRSSSRGEISLTDISKKYLNRMTQVSVLMKYFIAAPISSKLSVVGRNLLSNEMVTMDLSQYGDAYCTRVLFFGAVDEVEIDD